MGRDRPRVPERAHPGRVPGVLGRRHRTAPPGPGLQGTRVPARRDRPRWPGCRAEEAEERWGDSAQWAQYAERAAEMTPEDWEAVAAATDALNADLAAAKRAGTAPGSDEANALTERHRAYYDAIVPGLAAWLREVVFANAEAHGIDPESARWE
ncbi:TipAS antibiotic-recognition domain-containing protein [Streptomyces lydicus]|uniref:TipAS antibiotic-recognition domain-containing protein n=1 Tax=Streptomyces lydicus TaxID=47763 RepID=UPI0037B785A9